MIRKRVKIMQEVNVSRKDRQIKVVLMKVIAYLFKSFTIVLMLAIYSKKWIGINLEAANGEELEPVVEECSSKNTQTVVSYLRSQLISKAFLTEDQLKHFSSFYRREFNLIFHLFRTNSNYNSVLKMEDEILLTLMKFRHNYYYTSLQSFFDVDQQVVHRIINFWTNHMYGKLQSVDFWSMN